MTAVHIYEAYSGIAYYGKRSTIGETVNGYMRMLQFTGVDDVESLPTAPNGLTDHGYGGSASDLAVLSLRRAGYSLTINAYEAGSPTTLRLEFCFSPASALQQAFYDLWDKVPLDEVEAKLLKDIAGWKATIRHVTDRVSAMEVARHISLDLGSSVAHLLLEPPVKRLFDFLRAPKRGVFDLIDERAVAVLRDANTLYNGPHDVVSAFTRRPIQ